MMQTKFYDLLKKHRPPFTSWKSLFLLTWKHVYHLKPLKKKKNLTRSNVVMGHDYCNVLSFYFAYALIAKLKLDAGI